MSQTPPEHTSPIGNLTAAFEFATRQREFEINQLTQRNNFFMIFQGVMIAGLVQSQGVAAPIISFLVCLVGVFVSLMQVGMAAGSKYWQIRWERAAKTTEIWLLASLRDERLVSSFLTADGIHLSNAEKARLLTINQSTARQNDPLTFGDGDITKANMEDLGSGHIDPRRILENWLILRKFSVSRIPIWTGIALTTFWLALLSFTVHIEGWTPPKGPSSIQLVPLKQG